MRTLLSVLVLAAAPLAQGLTVKVNDPKSHGLLADGLLSLDEAFQLYNGTIILSQLSAAERNQVVGLGSAVDRIEVDAAVVPVITLQANLTTLVGVLPQPVALTMQGIAGPTGRPVVDAATFAAALPVATNRASIHGFSLRNGSAGVVANTVGYFRPGVTAVFGDLDFAGQTVAGFHITAPAAPGNQSTPVNVHDVVMKGLPVGYLVQDSASSGGVYVTSEYVHMENVKIGLDLMIAGMAGTSWVEFFRSEMIGSDTCVRVRRTAASDSEMLVRFTIGTYIANRNVLDVQGNALGNTIVHHHHLYVRGGTGTADQALIVGPRTGRFDLHGSENVIEGNTTILAGRTTRRLWVQNSTFRNGSLTVDNEGVPLEPLWDIFESYPINVVAASRTPFTFDACELVRSPVNGGSTIGPVTLRGCFADSSPTTGSVTVTAAAPSRWIGQTSVVPSDPPIGTFVDLLLDYQPGMGGVWLFSAAESRPATTNVPFRFYSKLNPLIVVPGLYTLRDRVRLPVPNDPVLIGAEFYAQALNLPLAGQTWAAPVTLPRGGYFKFTR